MEPQKRKYLILSALKSFREDLTQNCAKGWNSPSIQEGNIAQKKKQKLEREPY